MWRWSFINWEEQTFRTQHVTPTGESVRRAVEPMYKYLCPSVCTYICIHVDSAGGILHSQLQERRWAGRENFIFNSHTRAHTHTY